MEVVHLPGHLIGPRDGARPVDMAKAKSIADSIREIGLISPIVVAVGKRIRNGTSVDGWDILAGQHRFKAMFEILNWQEIPCIVSDRNDLHSELVTIDENLMRRDLSVAQTALATARRKEIYEILHPETKRGAFNQHTAASRQNVEEQVARFTADTAQSTGRNERTIQRDARIGKAIGDDLRLIQGTSLDKGLELNALVNLPPEERKPLIERAARGEKVSARPFRVAADPLEDVEASERQVARLMDAWNAAGPEAREEFILRIDAPVFDRTRSGAA